MTRAAALCLLACLATVAAADQPSEWEPLFNGEDLGGWTVKIKGREAGDNFADTFRVEDRLLKVRYDNYPANDAGEPLFGERYGHLFWDEPLSHYRLRVEYRFVGEQTADGPGWATRNSGVMLHGQTAGSMALDQSFPDSLEAQLLGGLGESRGPRPTGNLCTPGTHVEIGGELVTNHCTESTSDTYHGEQWVTAELEVRGGEAIRHYINGQLVMEYARPRLEREGSDGPVMLTGGTISLQSESHPCDFRRVDLRRLDP